MRSTLEVNVRNGENELKDAGAGNGDSSPDSRTDLSTTTSRGRET